MSESAPTDESHLCRADSVLIVVQFLDDERVESVEDWVLEAGGLQTIDGLAAKVLALASEPGAMPRYTLSTTENRVDWGAAGESIEVLLRTAGDRAFDAALAAAFAELARWLRRRVSSQVAPSEDSVERHARMTLCVRYKWLRAQDLQTRRITTDEGRAVVALHHAPTQTLYTVRLRTIDDVVHLAAITWERDVDCR